MKPHDILPDQQNTSDINGVTVRKGSVAAFLANWQILEDVNRIDEHAQARSDIQALLPALHALGLFKVLTPRDPALTRLLAELQ